MDNNEFESKKKYIDATGVASFLDENISINLNEYGIYEEKLIKPEKGILPSVVYCTPNFNENVDETDIGEELFSKEFGVKHSDELGYYLSLFAGHVEEGDFRENGSSGGFTTWLCCELLELGLVDAVIHVKKSASKKTLFSYDISRTVEEVKQGSGTKYYPVELSEQLKDVKKTKQKYAVVGTPGFIMSLRLLSKLDPDISNSIQFMIGLVCGHLKSTKFAEYMGWQIGINPGNIIDINFRKKLEDCPANQYGIEVIGSSDGEITDIISSTKELHGQDWGQGFFKVYSSDYTDDVFNETADVTIGDAWLPEYVNDSKGNNIVIVRNTTINTIVQKAVMEGRLKFDSVEPKTIFKSQSSHYKHTHDELSYRLYKRDIEKKWRPVKRVESSKNNIPFLRRRVQDLREEIAKTSHEAYLYAVRNNNIDLFEKRMLPLSKRYRFLYRLLRLQKKFKKDI